MKYLIVKTVVYLIWNRIIDHLIVMKNCDIYIDFLKSQIIAFFSDVIPEKNYAPGKRGSTPAVNFLLEPKSSSKLFLKMFSMLPTGDRLNLHKVFI